MQTLGQKIKVLIRAKGWDMKDFAKEIGYDPSAFSRMLKTIDQEDKQFPRIAKALGVSVEWICSQTEIGKGNVPDIVNEPAAPYGEAEQEADLKREITELKKEMARLVEEHRKRGTIEEKLLNIIEQLTKK